MKTNAYRKICSILVLVLGLMLVVACSADEEKTFVSDKKNHSSLEDAYVLSTETDLCKIFSFDNTGYNAICFTMTAPEDGHFLITVTFNQEKNSMSNRCFKTFDRRGQIVHSLEKIKAGVPCTIDYPVSAGEKFSFSFEPRGVGSPSGTFSVCYNDHHKPGVYSEVTKQATCTENGLIVWPCELCNEIAQSQETQATGHQPSEEHVLSEPTCLSAGLKGITCNACGEILSSEDLPKVDHTPGKFMEIKKATCTESGINEQHCTVCNATLATENTDPLGHTLGKWVTTKEATCLEEGRKEQKCAVCDEVINTESIEKSTHSLDKWETVKEATCLEEGLRVQRCSICGEIINSQILEMISHSFGKWEVTSEPTEDTSGKQKRECYVCGYTEFATIEKLK